MPDNKIDDDEIQPTQQEIQDLLGKANLDAENGIFTQEEEHLADSFAQAYQDERNVLMELFNWSQGIAFLIMLGASYLFDLIVYKKIDFVYATLFVAILSLVQVVTYTIYSKVKRDMVFQNLLINSIIALKIQVWKEKKQAERNTENEINKKVDEE